MRNNTRRGARLLALSAVVAVALAACSGGSTGGNSGSNAPASAASNAPVASTGADKGNGSILGGSVKNLAGINSYQFTMTMAGGSFGSMVGMLGAGAGKTADPNAGFTIKGVVITKPSPMAKMEMMGMTIIEADGYQYMDIGMGSYVKSKATGSSIVDSFSPQKIFGSTLDSTASGYKQVGTESKNGISANHFTASADAFKSYAGLLGVKGSNATWQSDIWIAADGGYPVSYLVKATDGDKTAYMISFDISNVNDAANKVDVPTNVMGG